MIRHILVPLDGSRLAECVLPHATAVARAFEAHITLLHVLGGTQTAQQIASIDPLSWHINKAESQAYLEGVAAQLKSAGIQVESRILEGKPAERIIEYTHTEDVDLAILSSHGQSGLSGWNISSVVQKILMRAYISIMIVRAYQPIPEDLASLGYRRLLVPLDCSKRAECALPLALKLASYRDSEIVVTHIVQQPEIPCDELLSPEDRNLIEALTTRSQEIATVYIERLHTYYGRNIETHLEISSTTYLTLQKLVEQQSIDLVVLSAHGSSGNIKWPYGSLVISFIAYGTSPLLIIQDITPNKIAPTQAEIAAREQKGH